MDSSLEYACKRLQELESLLLVDVPEKRYCNMIKPASAGFLLWKNINLNISMVLAKSAAEGLNISCNRYTVYLWVFPCCGG